MNSWFAWQGKNGGKAIFLSGAYEWQAANLWSFHGYPTEAEAEQKPNSVNWLTGQEADALIASYNNALTGNASTPPKTPPTSPVGSGSNQLNQAGGGIVQAATGINVNSITDAVSAIWDKISDGKMWRSLGWLALGVFLIIFGLILWLGPTAFKATPVGRVLG